MPRTELNRSHNCRQLQEQLARYEFWQWIITIDNTWIPYFKPETKIQSKEWRKPELKASAVPSVGKIMLTVFWDWESERYYNAEYYSNLLFGRLRQALVKKNSGNLHKHPLLQHTARKTKDVLKNLWWEIASAPTLFPGSCRDYVGKLKKLKIIAEFPELWKHPPYVFKKWCKVYYK